MSFFQVVSTLLRINTKFLFIFLVISLFIYVYTYLTNSKHQKQLYSKEITFLPNLLKWVTVIIVYSFIMFNLVNLEINLGKDLSERISMFSFWLIIFTAFFVFLTSLIIEFDENRFEKLPKFISRILSKWSKITFSMLGMVVVAVAYGFLTNAIMYLYTFSTEMQEISSTKQILYEFYDLDLVIPFVPIFLGLGLIAVLITNKFWSFIMEILLAEKEVVDIRLLGGDKILNVYLYKSPMGKYIYAGNSEHQVSATQTVAVNKDEIETIIFKREFKDFQENNQIIIEENFSEAKYEAK
jgi:hypothetical protein